MQSNISKRLLLLENYSQSIQAIRDYWGVRWTPRALVPLHQHSETRHNVQARRHSNDIN